MLRKTRRESKSIKMNGEEHHLVVGQICYCKHIARKTKNIIEVKVT